MANKGTLPQETLTDILSRLPIKSLTRFQSVSKPFSALINSPAFISAHLRRSSRHSSFFFRHFNNPSGSNFSFFLNNNQIGDVEVPLLGCLIRFPKIVGSCNGLVCLDISSCYARAFVLWNIARKQYSCLPSPRISDSRRAFWMVSTGFGFDRKKNDYKVVRIVSFGCEKDESPVVMAEVFSWRTFCWRVIEASIGACAIHEGQNGVVVNGGLHWLGNSAGKSGIQKFIVSFDLDTEEFRKIPIPDFPAGICVKIMGFKGSLALAFYPAKEVDVHSRHGRPGVADWIEFCVWDECDGADGKCWTKLNSIQLTTVGYPVGVANETGLIIKKLMEGQGAQFILFDPSNQYYRGMHICDASYSCDVHSYVESLVPVSGGGHDQVIEEEPSECCDIALLNCESCLKLNHKRSNRNLPTCTTKKLALPFLLFALCVLNWHLLQDSTSPPFLSSWPCAATLGLKTRRYCIKPSLVHSAVLGHFWDSSLVP
ncbi:hypothetical protein NC652_029025 [Populus alba x Populus x berolinensis]|nr:hypothetical protein NC652_029025 [Populus alba x Populus x berolinensis]KAJ6976702.1 hypothetical protein NC653_028765 [Populus alba x Populus x berolinensis]